MKTYLCFVDGLETARIRTTSERAARRAYRHMYNLNPKAPVDCEEVA